MVCANVGGLLLSRATARDRDTAVRLALGASLGRILSQWFMEGLLLTVVGGSAGLLVAYASIPMQLGPDASA
jgi:ABC-type antimicrobial peptide transport system permease subunit